jgi:hypothetical protein
MAIKKENERKEPLNKLSSAQEEKKDVVWSEKKMKFD